jgi:hypothetical protein
MGCCGNNRAALAQPSQAKPLGSGDGTSRQATKRPAAEAVHFQYTGKTALSVRGMFSRRIYRFAAPMAVLEVEGRDAPGLAAVPLLKRVSAPDC